MQDAVEATRQSCMYAPDAPESTPCFLGIPSTGEEIQAMNVRPIAEAKAERGQSDVGETVGKEPAGEKLPRCANPSSPISASGSIRQSPPGSRSPECIEVPYVSDSKDSSENKLKRKSTETLQETVKRPSPSRQSPASTTDANAERPTPTYLRSRIKSPPSPHGSSRQSSSLGSKSAALQATPLIAKQSAPGVSSTSDAELQPEKLTKRQAERLERQKLREAEKAERDRKKEDERRLKQEERERKELERKQRREALEREKEEKREQERLRRKERRLKVEEEKKAKESERKLKEQERKQKDDERRKVEEMKERSQMKISNFFAVKPVRKEAAAASAATPLSTQSKTPSLRVASNELENTAKADSYLADFLPFFQKRNVLLAQQAQLPPDLLAAATQAFDAELSQCNESPCLSDVFRRAPAKSNGAYTSTQQMVDALNSSHMTEAALSKLVEELPPVKYLQFYENAKPPYVGTWCSEKHLATVLLPQQPLDTSATGLDYGYDSDLDWQEGDEGEEEDIDDLDEGDEEEDEADDDEMEDFVDNTEPGKRGHVGPLQSVSIWNDGSHDELFDEMKYERLSLAIDFPIDPFKDYWSAPKEAKDVKPQAPTELKKALPLISLLGTPVKTEAAIKSPTPNVLTPQKPVIQDEQVKRNLVQFIKENSDFSIGTLAELAKKEFKVFTKSILKHTIQELAFYNKKTSTWEIKDAADTNA